MGKKHLRSRLLLLLFLLILPPSAVVAIQVHLLHSVEATSKPPAAESWTILRTRFHPRFVVVRVPATKGLTPYSLALMPCLDETSHIFRVISTQSMCEMFILVTGTEEAGFKFARSPVVNLQWG